MLITSDKRLKKTELAKQAKDAQHYGNQIERLLPRVRARLRVLEHVSAALTAKLKGGRPLNNAEIDKLAGAARRVEEDLRTIRNSAGHKSYRMSKAQMEAWGLYQGWGKAKNKPQPKAKRK
jgi:hypothetical protein